MTRPPTFLRAGVLGVSALSLVATLVVAGCGDPFVSIWVKNESAAPVVVSITDGEYGPTTSFLAGPGVVGTTLSRGGHFRGTVKVTDASCRTMAVLNSERDVLVVAITESGDAKIVTYADAFPGNGPDPDGAVLPLASQCPGAHNSRVVYPCLDQQLTSFLAAA
jgi:hypothetical protein